ncbi:hypothetical protein, partial [Paenibacillus odorifer]|uniref:hypothetical protein n=1 Tax=Paenibacillus odorifer TaxID=189426 RepID=UPI001C4AB317
ASATTTAPTLLLFLHFYVPLAPIPLLCLLLLLLLLLLYRYFPLAPTLLPTSASIVLATSTPQVSHNPPYFRTQMSLFAHLSPFEHGFGLQ